MKKLLNVLYITTPDVFISLEGENVLILKENKKIFRIPIHNLESIVCFNFQGISPKLMGKCIENGIMITFITPYGRFLATVNGKSHGNILVRKKQYLISTDKELSTKISKHFIIGKLYNCRMVIERGIRDHKEKVDTDKLKVISQYLKKGILKLSNVKSLDEIIGVEGDCAKNYFGVFNELIISQKSDFKFEGRNRRPPLDKVNALLSFLYSLLSLDMQAGIESAMLDSYAGILHQDRSGRASLALDLMEELRPYFVDRLVLKLINLKIISKKDFVEKENGAILLTENARKIVLDAWQKRKQEEITHPFLKEKIKIGLIPYIQGQLFARYIRGDLEEYPPFLMR